MSKNLEKEYKELMIEDVPDLWDRIEGGLEPQQQAAKKADRRRKYRVWGAAAAACLCLAVTAPVIFMGNESNSTSEKFVTDDYNTQADGTAGANAGDNTIFEETTENSSGDTAAVNEAAEIYDSESEETAAYAIRAKVLETSVTDGGIAYIVQIEDTDITELSPGEEIKLYAGETLEEELTEGESYLLDISVAVANNDIIEYLINNVRYE